MVRRENTTREREREREHERRTRKDLNTHLSLIVKTGLWTICFDVTTSLVLFYTSYCWITLFLLWFCKTNLVSHRLSWDVQDNTAKSIFSSKVKLRCIVLPLFLASVSLLLFLPWRKIIIIITDRLLRRTIRFPSKPVLWNQQVLIIRTFVHSKVNHFILRTNPPRD